MEHTCSFVRDRNAQDDTNRRLCRVDHTAQECSSSLEIKGHKRCPSRIDMMTFDALSTLYTIFLCAKMGI